jgi:hypothetical protein
MRAAKRWAEADPSDNAQATRLQREASAALDHERTGRVADALALVEAAVREEPARDLRPLVERIGRAYSWGLRRLAGLERDAVRAAVRRAVP